MKPFIFSLAALGIVSFVAYLMRRRRPVKPPLDDSGLCCMGLVPNEDYPDLAVEPILEQVRKESLLEHPQGHPNGSVAFCTESFYFEWQVDPLRLGETIWLWPRLHDGTKNNDESLKLVFQKGKSTHGCAHSEALALWVRKQLGSIVEGREISQVQLGE